MYLFYLFYIKMIFVLETFDKEKLYIVDKSEQDLLNSLNTQKFIHLSFWQGGVNVSSIKRYYDKSEKQDNELNVFEDNVCLSSWLSDYINLLKNDKVLSSSARDRFILNYNKNTLWTSSLKQSKKLTTTKTNSLNSFKI